MNFKAAEINCFFDNGPQMALSNDTHSWLDRVGLVTIGESEDFKIDQFKNVIMNLCMDIPDITNQLYSNGGILVHALLQLSHI